MFEHAYNVTHDDEDLLGGVDSEQRSLLQALRIGITPIELLHEQFDDTIRPESPLPVIEAAVFAQEVERIAQLSAAGRADLAAKLERAKRAGINQRSNAGLGKNVRGFVMDTATMEFAMSKREGEHALVRDELEQMQEDRLRREYRDWAKVSQEGLKAMYRWAEGYIYLSVETYHAPILRFNARTAGSDSHGNVLYKEPLEGTKAGAFLHQLRICIPINSDGTLIR